MESLLKPREAPEHEEILNSRKQKASSSFLHPYRKIGIIVDQNSAVSGLHISSDKYLLTLSVGPLFHTYDIQNFKLISALPFSHSLENIAKIGHFKDLTVLQYSTRFALYKKAKLTGYLVQQSHSQILDSLVCGTLVIALCSKRIIVLWQIPTSTKEFQEIQEFKPFITHESCLPFDGLHLFHPNTYVNKVLVYDESDSMLILNIHSQKIVYQFSLLQQYLQKHKLSLGGPLVQSPIPHIVALSTDKPTVLLWNLNTDCLVMRLSTGSRVTSLSFSNDSKGALKDWSLLATGLDTGQILFWDLNGENKFTLLDLQKVLFRQSDLKRDYKLSIGMCTFVESGVVVTTGGANFIGLFLFETDDLHSPPRLLRSRKGHLTHPHFIRFYEGGVDQGSGSHTRHILSVSASELRNNALLNDAQSIDYSFRKAYSKGLKVPDSDFCSFAFSVFRQRDWANVLTYHEQCKYPFLWSSERHAIGATQIEEKNKAKSEEKKEALSDLLVRSVAVSACGNFGVAGYSSGKIIKFTMQSGTKKYEIKCEPVGVIVLDSMNKVLVNCSTTGAIICRDFYGGNKIFFKDVPILRENAHLKPLPLIKARLCDHNNLLATADISGRIYIYDLKTYLQSRILRYGSAALQITDLAFLLPVGRILLSSSRDGSLLFWDLLSGSILERAVFDIPVLSIDVSHSGEFIATAHTDSLAIHLWVNKSRFETLQATGASGVPIHLTKRPKLMRRMKKGKEVEKKEEKIETPEVISKVPRNKWKILMHLDEIKRRNQAKLPQEEVSEMPFFLFDLEAITKEQDVWEDKAQEEGFDLFDEFNKPRLYDNRKDTLEHFIKAGDKNYELQLKELLKREVEDMKEVIELMERLAPSAIQYEIGSLRYADQGVELDLQREKEELLRKLKILLRIVGRALQEGYHIDTAQAVLSQVLKNYDEELLGCQEEVEKVLEVVEVKGREMRELCGGVECMVDHLIEGSRKK